MIRTILNEKYTYKLISLMLESSYFGVFIANFIAPISAIYVVKDYMSFTLLFIWLLLHIFLLASRIYLSNYLKKFMNVHSKSVNRYLNIIYLLSFSTTLLFSYLVWMSVLLDIPNVNIFVLGIIVLSLSACSISTLGSVYKAFLIFISFNFLFLISALLYHGAEMFIMFAITMSVMMAMLIYAGRVYYLNLRNSISNSETFKTIYENSTDGIVVMKNNKYVGCNKAILEMFHIPSKEMFLQTEVMAYMPEVQPDGKNSFRKMTRKMHEAFKHGSAKLEWLHKDYNGDDLWCEIVLTKIHLDGEELLHGAWRDISERKEIQEIDKKHKKEIELLNANLEERIVKEVEINRLKDRQMMHQSRLAQMGEMLAMIAHQWRQPLSAIASANATMNVRAELDDIDKESTLKTTASIDKFIKHLSSTIDDFRNFFKQNKKLSQTSYLKITKSVLHLMDASLKSKGVEVKLDLKCTDEFSSYENELKQVLLNLITNAQDALLEKEVKEPYIELKSCKENETYVLEVCDNGYGINADIIEKVFDPYFSTKKNKEGTGLGLYMSKLIIEEHCEGKISCVNEANGTCFKVELPSA
ncbi:MAG: PAS domain-containing sensor histidine kinase [Campylobacterota bacterium]|nr:PAS domain-containing sensor histidine kinase [Campylobacterota bacterium]